VWSTSAQIGTGVAQTVQLPSFEPDGLGFEYRRSKRIFFSRIHPELRGCSYSIYIHIHRTYSYKSKRPKCEADHSTSFSVRQVNGDITPPPKHLQAVHREFFFRFERDMDVQLKCAISCRGWAQTFIAMVQTNPSKCKHKCVKNKAIMVKNCTDVVRCV
jgi:hypothetical protein